MNEIAREIVTHYADDPQNWQEQFAEYPLPRIEDIVYDYLFGTGDNQERMIKQIAEEIFCSTSCMVEE